MSMNHTVYLKAYHDARDARTSLGIYFRFYNTEHPHQSHDYRTPAKVYSISPVESVNGGVVESLTPDPLGIAEPALNNLSKFRGLPHPSDEKKLNSDIIALW